MVPSRGSTIQRWSVSLAADRAALLEQEGEARSRPAELLAQDLLGAAVGCGDEIARPLDRDLQVLDLAEVAHQMAGGLVRRLHHDVDVGRAKRHEADCLSCRCWSCDLAVV